MELGTLIGLIIGIFLTVFAIYQSANYEIDRAMTFINWPSVMITIGGTFMSTLVAIPLKKFFASFRAIGIIFKPPKLNQAVEIDKIVTLANIARKEGILALEEKVNTLEDDFLSKGIMLIVDGTDPELVREIMETELAYIDERHGDIAATFDFIASEAPAWGMIGTLIGLILMLLEMEDPTHLGPNMAVALVTTFYGSMIAYFLATPIANKMRLISKEEILLKTALIEGMLSIQGGENPRIIEEKLKSFLSPAIRDEVKNGVRRRKESDQV